MNKDSPSLTRPAHDPFDTFWTAYPKREGSNPKKPARARFAKLCRDGADPNAIIAGARRYAELESKNIGTRYIKRADHWLNEWSPGDDAPPPDFKSTMIFVEVGSPAWRAWEQHWRAAHPGRIASMPRRDMRWPTMNDPIRTGYLFDTALPPGYSTDRAAMFDGR